MVELGTGGKGLSVDFFLPGNQLETIMSTTTSYGKQQYVTI